MERFRIAQYGFIQMVALAYGILGSSTAAKAGLHMTERGLPTTPMQWAVSTYHDYGFALSLLIIAWAAFCAYHSTSLSRRNMSEGAIAASGITLAFLFFAIGSVMIFMTLGALVSNS